MHAAEISSRAHIVACGAWWWLQMAHTARSQLALPLASALFGGVLMAFAPQLTAALGVSAGLFLATLAATKQMGDAAEHLFASIMVRAEITREQSRDHT